MSALWATILKERNRASIRVAEKIGMAFEKEGRDELGPFHLYAINQLECTN